MKLLKVVNLTIRYGGIMAVSNLTFSVDEGQTVVLMGPNGSGKSSVLLAIMGIVKPCSGAILFKGENLARLKPWDRVGKGIAILPENRRLFEDMSVDENLDIISVGKLARISPATVDSFDYFPYLRDRRSLPVRLLSGGERQALAVLRLIRQAPILALMDDPCSGLDKIRKHDALSILAGVGIARILALPMNTTSRDLVLGQANMLILDEKGDT